MLLGFWLVTPLEAVVARPLLVATLSVLPGHLGLLYSSPLFSSASVCVATRAPAVVTAVARGAADAAFAAPTVTRDVVSRMTTLKQST